MSIESSSLGRLFSRGGLGIPLMSWILVSLGTCRQWVMVRWLGTFIAAGDCLCGRNDLPKLSRTLEEMGSWVVDEVL